MAKLILEEGGKRRRFRLNEGKMTIGSGEAATLTLADDEVAEVHAELVFKDGKASLVPRKGVAPLKMMGRPVRGEVPLKDGVPVMLGKAKLIVDYELSGPAEDTPAGARKKAAGEGAKERVQRTRSRVDRKPGIPGWMTAVAILAVVVVGIFLVKNSFEDGEARAVDENTSKVRIEDFLREGDYKGALRELDRVELESMSPEWTRAFARLREEAESAKRAGSDGSRNAQGNPYLETQLKKFVTGRLKKDPSSRPKTRVFIKRAKWFLAQYPTHPEKDWVQRHIDRYAPVAALHEASTFEDVSFEVESLTWAYPADYKQAFKVLSDFRPRATETEQGQLGVLESELRSAEKEYFDTRFDEAQNFWSVDPKTNMRRNPGKAVERLVQMVIKLDNQEYANKAATTLSKMESKESSILSIFRGYRNDRPDTWEALLANNIVREFLEQHDVI